MDRETLLDLFVNSMPDPVVISDTEHKILYLNREAENLFEGGAGLPGKSLFDCHNEESRKKLVSILRRLENGEEEVQITERRGENTENIQHTFMRAIRDSEGNLVGYYERYQYWGKRID